MTKCRRGQSLIEIDLIEHDGGTLLRMTHSGLPNAATKRATPKAGSIISAG